MSRSPLHDEADHLMNHARTAFSSGRFGEAIDGCREALICGGEPRTRALALQTLVEALLHTDRLAEANAALDELRTVARADEELSVAVAEPESRLRLAAGDYARALEVARRAADAAGHDVQVMADRDALNEIEIKSLFFLGRQSEAASRLRDCLRDGHLPLSIPEISDVLEAEGSDLREMVDLFPPPALSALLFAISEAPGTAAAALMDAVWERYGTQSVVLTFAAEIGARLPVISALDWSMRLRQAGRAEQCTLLALARNEHRTPRERALAAACALEMFNDLGAMALLEPALAAIPDEQTDLVMDEMRLLAPGIALAIEPVSAT
jgi:tetratricopeptide (TPR) repeat protein